MRNDAVRCFDKLDVFPDRGREAGVLILGRYTSLTPPEQWTNPDRKGCRDELFYLIFMDTEPSKSNLNPTVDIVDVDMEGEPQSAREGSEQQCLELPIGGGGRSGSVSSLSSAGSHKRKRDEASEYLSIGEELDAIKAMAGIRNKLDRFLADPNNKFNKSSSLRVLAIFNEANVVFSELCTENALLKGKLAKSVEPTAKRTLADIVQRNIPLARASKPPPLLGAGLNKQTSRPKRSYTLMVSSTDPQRSASEIQQKLQSNINPVRDNIRINRIRQTKSGKVFIDACSRADSDKIANSKALTDAGLRAAAPPARLPRLIVYDVPREFSEDAISEAVLSQNKELLEGLDKDSFTKEFVPKFRVGKREATAVHWIVEVTPGIRNRIRRSNKIYIGWSRCRVLDYLSLTRCHRCLDLGHVAKYCRARTETCAYCGNEGHGKVNCKMKSSSGVCGLCRRRGRPSDHAVDDKECSTYKMIMDRYKSSIDYG